MVVFVVAVDFLEGVAGLLSGQLAHGLLHVHDELGVDAHVSGGAADAAGRLVHEHTGVRGQVTLALGAGAQQELAHGSTHAQAHGRHVRLDELHGVVDGHAGGDGAARRVDVQPDVLLRVFGGQHQQLSADAVGHIVLDLFTHPDDAVFEQTVENRVDGAGRDVIARHDRQGRKGIAHLDSPSNYSNIVQTTALKRLKASFRVLFGG